jgi:hypothetical protein
MRSHLGSGLIDVGTARLYHEIRGTGPTALLIAGAIGCAAEWRQVGAYVYRHGLEATRDCTCDDEENEETDRLAVNRR